MGHVFDSLDCSSKRIMSWEHGPLKSHTERAIEGNLQRMKRQPRHIMLDCHGQGNIVISSVHIRWFVRRHRLVARSCGEYRTEPSRFRG